MSFKSLLHDERYFSERYHPERYYHDRFTTLNGRNYWNKHYDGRWNKHYDGNWHNYYDGYVPANWHRYHDSYWNPYWHRYTNPHGTLRFNVKAPEAPKVKSETSVFYPAPYTPPIWTAPPKTTEVKIVENIPLKRSNSFVSVSETKNESCANDKYDMKYDYKYQEEVDGKSISNSTSKCISKSCSDMNCEIPVNNVTYVYETDKDKHRHVTYVKQCHDDSESIAGNVVKSSDLLPTTRSVNVGPIFNGSSFGILSEHLTIRDTFHVAFQFKTTQQNGVLMSIVDRSSGDAFFIELYDSQLKATLFVDGEADSCWTDFGKPVLSNDIWSDVEVNIVNNRMAMTVRNETVNKTHRFPFRRPIRGDLFVAGFPTTAAPPFVCRSRDFFVGEMRNFYLNNDGVKWYGTASHVHPRLRNWYF